MGTFEDQVYESEVCIRKELVQRISDCCDRIRKNSVIIGKAIRQMSARAKKMCGHKRE